MKKMGILLFLLIIAMAILFSGCLQKNESALDATPQVTPQSPQEVQELKKPLLPKSVPLTPGETVEAFWMAMKEERYTDAAEYLTAESAERIMSMMRQAYSKNPPRSIEEALFHMFSRWWPPFAIDDELIGTTTIEWTSIEQIEILNEKYSTTERWSEEHKKPIEYQTATASYRVFLPEDLKEELREESRRKLEERVREVRKDREQGIQESLKARLETLDRVEPEESREILRKQYEEEAREALQQIKDYEKRILEPVPGTSVLEAQELEARELELIKIEGVWKIMSFEEMT